MKSTKELPKENRPNPSQTSEGEPPVNTSPKSTDQARLEDSQPESQPNVQKNEQGEPVTTAPETGNKKEEPPPPTGEGQKPEIRRAAAQETIGGGIRITNRGSGSIRIITEEKRIEGDWMRGNLVELRQNDNTEIVVSENLRVMIDMV